MTDLTLAAASTLIDGALTHARAAGLAPLAIVVLDAGAHMVAMKREDGASLFRGQIAAGKATGALGMGYGTRELAKRAQSAPLFYTALMAMTGEVVPSPGGVLIRDANGRLLGAIGVSGDTGDADEAAALAGISTAGLVGQPAG
jgi:uncharacterized protein GlcG (DUF336 family)